MLEICVASPLHTEVPWMVAYMHWWSVIWKTSSCISSWELHSRFGHRLPLGIYYTWCYQRSVYLFTFSWLVARSRLASYFMMDCCGVELNSILCRWYLAFHLVNMGIFDYVMASVFWWHVVNIKQVDNPMMLYPHNLSNSKGILICILKLYHSLTLTGNRDLFQYKDAISPV